MDLAISMVLYIVAMFGGSYQYEPTVFWAIVIGIVVAAALLFFAILRLAKAFRSRKASRAS